MTKRPLKAKRSAAAVTLHDEYGRCLHCGFWHEPSSIAEQTCAEHEAHGCRCAEVRVFFPLPKPTRGSDGKWYNR